ncbi:hypothetical protein EDB85DRAFT_1896215 [Lactarius pseudohatsudake]|nr:hypothetical protein EDB85DRAFT_1896215 [Lactarius pseudohatsudake]
MGGPDSRHERAQVELRNFKRWSMPSLVDSRRWKGWRGWIGAKATESITKLSQACVKWGHWRMMCLESLTGAPHGHEMFLGGSFLWKQWTYMPVKAWSTVTCMRVDVVRWGGERGGLVDGHWNWMRFNPSGGTHVQASVASAHAVTCPISSASTGDQTRNKRNPAWQEVDERQRGHLLGIVHGQGLYSLGESEDICVKLQHPGSQHPALRVVKEKGGEEKQPGKKRKDSENVLRMPTFGPDFWDIHAERGGKRNNSIACYLPSTVEISFKYKRELYLKRKRKGA